MMSNTLDQETKRYLSEILAQENITSDELIRGLIRDRWLSLRQESIAAPRALEADQLQSNSVPSFQQKSNRRTIAEFMRKKTTR